ncbi:hypothetical protein BIV57_03555 [Mangrovactinospora gilvigrisea]|uniref:Uncharacterized protein n=2 Tax=Mangrovactinospora gilvigrisea TaxID=1428644 RepID=A0A1J7BJH1_9ACTN|nr:hypothetical protein BIV57_03555 [Mangrovactinospora gilvigrisea]
MPGCDVRENWTRFPDRREEGARRALAAPDPAPPAGLAREVFGRARRLRAWRRWAALVAWLALFAGAAFLAWWFTRPPGVLPLEGMRPF